VRSGLLAGFVRRYAAARVPSAATVVDLWPGDGSPFGEFATEAAASAPDVVLGVAPWGLERVRATVGGRALVGHAAHIRALEGCVGMSPEGAGIFVFAMGFLADRRRDGVGANLEAFGLHIEAVLALPRGLLYPDSGPGRVLVGIRRGPPRVPVVARLTRDGTSIEEPLARLG
jgi:hypothetical protein